MNWLRRLLGFFGDPDPEQIAIHGATLTDAEAEAIEAKVKAAPGNVRNRLKLLGYYMGAQYRNPDIRPRRAEHVLWFLENEPGGRLAGSPFCQVEPLDPAYPRVCKVWDRLLADPDVPAAVILNAANFFTLANPAQSTALLERGERLDSTNPDWAQQLGNDLLRQVHTRQTVLDRDRKPDATPDAQKISAAKALGHLERALRLASTTGRRFQILPNCGRAAMHAGRWDEAVRYADEILALAPQCEDERHRPDYIHEAHVVRGHGFLQAGNLDAACRELDLAGQQGSEMAPVLRSFGPDFGLAQQLLVRGRKAAVGSYLRQVATFWMPDRVGKWRAAIDRGETPWMFIGFDPEEMNK